MKRHTTPFISLPASRTGEGKAAAEMPEIAVARALLAALAQTEELRAEATQRHPMTQLQVAYGNALIARGFGAPETTEAFARAHRSAFSEQDAPERLAADFGLWAASYSRGDLASMRAHSGTFSLIWPAAPIRPKRVSHIASRARQPRARGRSLRDRPRGRKAASHAQLRTARRAPSCIVQWGVTPTRIPRWDRR